jgi:hypothetical protein
VLDLPLVGVRLAAEKYREVSCHLTDRLVEPTLP